MQHDRAGQGEQVRTTIIIIKSSDIVKLSPIVSHNVSKKDEPTANDDTWLTLSEAIAYTKISRSTLYRLMDEGVVPYYRVAGTKKRRFRRSELDQLMIREEPGQGNQDDTDDE